MLNRTLRAYLLAMMLIEMASAQAANESPGGWQIYRNERYAFRVSYPAPSEVKSERNRRFQYVRIQNSAADADIDAPYVAEIFIYDHRLGHRLPKRCRDLLLDGHAARVGRVMGFRGSRVSDETQQPASVVCVESTKVDVLVEVAEGELDSGLAKRILDSVRFGE